MPRKITRRTTKDLTYDRLHEVLNYDPKTGTWTWKTCMSSKAQTHAVAGCVNHHGYRVVIVGGKQYKSSRLAFLYMLGYFPENDVDHKNRIRDDDRWDNLREVSSRCNMRNRCVAKDNKSGITGVFWVKSKNRWRVRIKPADKNIHVGCFKTKKEAAQARWEAEVKYGFPNCNTSSSAYLFLKGSS